MSERRPPSKFVSFLGRLVAAELIFTVAPLVVFALAFFLDEPFPPAARSATFLAAHLYLLPASTLVEAIAGPGAAGAPAAPGPPVTTSALATVLTAHGSLVAVAFLTCRGLTALSRGLKASFAQDSPSVFDLPPREEPRA